MRKQIIENIEIPSDVSCEFSDNIFKCRKGSSELLRTVNVPLLSVQIKGKEIILDCAMGKKNDLKVIKSLAAHIKNMFLGLNEKYTYKLQAVNVHFPMTLKVDGSRLMINNFLGEKVPRFAQIRPNVIIEVKGQAITLSSHDKEAVGQTAANIEKATKIKSKDRRVFQDGIYIIEKAGRII